MKKVIIQDPDGKLLGPISERELEEGLKNNALKRGFTVYYIDRMYNVEEIHESKLVPFVQKSDPIPYNDHLTRVEKETEEIFRQNNPHYYK